MEGQIAGASREDATDDDCDVLETFSTVADMASKAQLLQSLSMFLSCVATTMSFSTEFNTLSARVGGSSVFLGHKEVTHLHELVVRELNDQTYFLSTLSSICNRQVKQGAEGDFTTVLKLKIVSQTLRCCIRILPIVDCFDKNASLASTKVLDGILQQLCHPSKLFHLLKLKPSEDIHDERSHRTAQGDEDGTYLENAGFHEAWMANVLDMDPQHRKELIFAMLEVYLDELLLHPDLIARLLRSREDTCGSFSQEQMTCRVKHTEASLEAAFVYLLSSLYSASFCEASPGSRRKGFLAGNLSLPAGLVLLERFSTEGVPPFYIAHVVRLLAGMLNDTTPVSFGLVDDLCKTGRILLKNCWAGGVDWSYCSQELLPNFDFNDYHCLTGSLPSEITLNFASSILEQAILLYARLSLPLNTCADGCLPIWRQTLENPLLGFYVSKYTPLFDPSIKGPKLDAAGGVLGREDIGIGYVDSHRDYCHCCSTGTLDTANDFFLEDGTGIFYADQFARQCPGAGCHGVERRNIVVFDDVKDTAGLVAALLQLMSSALKCIGREVRTTTCLTDALGDTDLDPRARSSSEANQADFDKILQCVGLCLNWCFPVAPDHVPICHERRCGSCGQDDGESQESLNNMVGQAIVFFTTILRGDVRRGAPDELLEDYFHLIESLVALLLALDERLDSRKSTLECDGGCNCTPRDDICSISFKNDEQQLRKFGSTSRYLEEMVLALRGVLHDLSEQQRPMPEFFLFFILKQLSSRDALSLVGMALSSCFHNQSGVLQNIIGKPELFQTEGFVTEVLHLSLLEPTKPYSLLTFIVYMVDILQDHISITAAMSTSEIAEPISSFETAAYILTLASQLVVCERTTFIRNGKEFFSSLISKISQGIDRMLTEGIAAAHWLSHHCKTMSEEVWQKAGGSGTVPGGYFGGEAWNLVGNLGQCNSFLDQVDTLRNAVEELARSVDASIDCELTPLLAKGMIFFAALSELPTEQILSESRWRLYLSEQTLQRSPEVEPGSRLPVDSLALAVGCAADTDGFQKEFSDRIVEGNQESQDAPGSGTRAECDQSENVSCSGELSSPIGSHLAGQEEVITAPSNSDTEFNVSGTVVTVEKRQTRSATSLLTRQNTLDDGLGSEKPQLAPQGRKRCSASTSAIIRRLLGKTSPSRGKSTASHQICDKRPAKASECLLGGENTSEQEWVSCDFVDDVMDGDVSPSTSVNLYVNSLCKQDPSSDSFDDLKDFIVTKRGRDYSRWLKRRQKVRRRLYSKNFFKRLREKKELLLLLDM